MNKIEKTISEINSLKVLINSTETQAKLMNADDTVLLHLNTIVDGWKKELAQKEQIVNNFSK